MILKLDVDRVVGVTTQENLENARVRRKKNERGKPPAAGGGETSSRRKRRTREQRHVGSVRERGLVGGREEWEEFTARSRVHGGAQGGGREGARGRSSALISPEGSDFTPTSGYESGFARNKNRSKNKKDLLTWIKKRRWCRYV